MLQGFWESSLPWVVRMGSPNSALRKEVWPRCVFFLLQWWGNPTGNPDWCNVDKWTRSTFDILSFAYKSLDRWNEWLLHLPEGDLFRFGTERRIEYLISEVHNTGIQFWIQIACLILPFIFVLLSMILDLLYWWLVARSKLCCRLISLTNKVWKRERWGE